MEYCVDCKYCRLAFWRGRRASFFCIHPDGEYIRNWCKEHKYVKMVAFIGYSKCFVGEPAIKTSPRWCPLKKKKA